MHNNPMNPPEPHHIPPGVWHVAIKMQKSDSYLIANLTDPIVGTMTTSGNWTPLRSDSMQWLSKGGYLDQLAPKEGALIKRDDVAKFIYGTLGADKQNELSGWQSDSKKRNRVLNYGHRFIYFATYLGLLEKVAPHTWRRTGNKLEDLMNSPYAIQNIPAKTMPPKEAALRALFQEFLDKAIEIIDA